MASRVSVDVQYRVADAQGIHIEQAQHLAFTPGVSPNGQRQAITLTASIFTAITVPSGAKFMALILSGATGLTLKGNTSDVGISLTPTSNPITGLDVLMPLGATPTVGITSATASDQVIEAIFF